MTTKMISLLAPNKKISSYFIALSLTLFPIVQASAQVFKCKDEKGKITYSDVACKSSGSQTVSDISTQPTAQPVATESSLSRQLDNAVRRAIASGDLSHAETLAVTSQQWEWIATARKENERKPVLGRTEADLSSEKGNSHACMLAKRDYEFEAGSYKQVQNSIDAKRSMMHAACGVKEPTTVRVDNRTVIQHNRTVIHQRMP